MRVLFSFYNIFNILNQFLLLIYFYFILTLKLSIISINNK